MANSVARRGSMQQAPGPTGKDVPITAFAQGASYHPNQRNPNEMVHAAEVLASFNQYPIRNTIFQGYTNQSLPPVSRPGQDIQQGYISDPLVQDIQSHSRDLVTTLLPILNTQEGDPGTKFDINNCKGVNHIAGAMMPPPDEEDLSRLSRISSPTSRSSLGSGNQCSFPQTDHPQQHQLQQQPIQQHGIPQHGIPQPPSRSSTTTDQGIPQSPIKAETPGFQTTFQFVVNENAKEARNTVRKHVMKEFRRRERWEQGQKGVASGAIEKKPAASKKRRRRQDTPSDNDQKTPIDTQTPAHFDIATPFSARRDSTSQNLELNSPVIELSKGNWLDVSNLHTNRGSVMDNANTRAPNRKKNKVLTAPVFPESKQVQLWGAVSTDYNNAIMELESRSREPYRNDPWATVGIGQVDPFSKLNLDLGPATQSLLHHFAWVMPSLMDSIVTGKTFHRLGWLYSAVAIHDPTPVHVILGYTLGHIASLRGLEEPPQAIEHKSKAIKLLNHRMADPKQSYSDELIGAIVNFAGWELICANPKAYAMHMNGLSRIVTARGGMSAFESKPELETVLVRLDAIRAYVSQSSPRYPAYSFVRALEPVAINIPYIHGRSTWTATTASQPLYSPYQYRYCEDALSLMNKLEDVLLLCRSAASDLSGPVGEPFHKLLLKSMEQLLAKPTFLEEDNSRRASEDIYANYAAPQETAPAMPEMDRIRLTTSALAIRLAALTMLDAAIREFFDSPPYAGYYTSQLKHRFLGCKAMANDSPLGRSMEMLIAVLIQADRMALERPWRAWYAADALTLTMRITQYKWEEIGAALKEWVLEGGLDSSQPRIVEEKSDIKHADIHQLNNDANNTGADPESVLSEPRSRDVWDLRSVASNFLREWEEGPQPQLSPVSQSVSGPPVYYPMPAPILRQPMYQTMSNPAGHQSIPVSSAYQPMPAPALHPPMVIPTTQPQTSSLPSPNLPPSSRLPQDIHPGKNRAFSSSHIDLGGYHGLGLPLDIEFQPTSADPSIKHPPTRW